jgi:hypothetical protein
MVESVTGKQPVEIYILRCCTANRPILIKSNQGNARMHAAIDPQKVSKVLGEVHLIDAFLTTRLRNFTCYRCKRSLPEGQFAYLGPRFIKSSRRPLSALHPHCHKCREQENGEWVKHPLYSPELDRFWKVKFISVRSSALNRDIFLGVEYQDLLGKHLEQEGRCALTGMEMKLVDVGGTNVKSGRNLAAPSVDRIDSAKHYTPDNIQIVMAAVNMMKGELPQEVFLEFCDKIAGHRLTGML